MHLPIIFQGDEIDIIVTTTSSILSSSDLKFVLQLAGEEVAALTKTEIGGGITEDTATQFTVTLAKADTINLIPGEYKIQALFIDASSKEKVISFDPAAIQIKARLNFV